MDDATLSELKRLDTLRLEYVVDVLNKVNPKMIAKLSAPAHLNVRMQNGRHDTVPLMGDNRFTVHAVECDGADIKLRLAPTVREEFSMAFVSSAAFKFFDFQYKPESEFCSFQELIATVLQERDPKLGKTYREQIDVVIEAERKKILAATIAAHDDYGTW